MIQDRRIRTSLVAILADIVLTAIKAFLALLTGSAALLADAFHSATDFIVSFILLCGIVIRSRQEKKQSENGIKMARRIESALAILVALIILYVPVEIVQAISGEQDEQIDNLWIGILGMLVVIAIVFFMARLKTHVGQETDSPALEADGYHSLVDLFSSFAVLLSLVGFMVGIYLDSIVALLIAVMIGLSGVELLISGCRSLIKGTDFDQLSLTESVVEVVQRIPVGTTLSNATRAASKKLYQLRYPSIALVVAAYLLSGLQQVPFGYVGVKQVFNQSVAQPLSPGLHYGAPWPIGRILTFPDGQVMETTVGSSVQLAAQNEHNLWREIKENRVLNENIPYLVTGDENLIDINFTLQYRLKNPTSQLMLSNALPDLVKAFSESTLAEHTGHNRFNQVMQTSYTEFADRLAQGVYARLAEIGIEIQVIDAQIQSIQPPAMVVSSYRDVLTADQERQQRINRAIAQRLNDLPVANAQVITEYSSVQATAAEHHFRAQGDAQRMGQLAEVYGESPDAFKFNFYMDRLTETLTDKTLIIADPAIAQDDIRNWLIHNQDKRK